jgi:hypothetical protein
MQKRRNQRSCSVTWVARFYSPLSNASSFMMTHPSTSLIIFCFFLLPVYLITLLWTGTSVRFCWIYPNHVKWWCTSFSSPWPVPPLVFHVCHRFGPDLLFCCYKSIIAYTSQLRLIAGYVKSLLLGQHFIRIPIKFDF